MTDIVFDQDKLDVTRRRGVAGLPRWGGEYEYEYRFAEYEYDRINDPPLSPRFCYPVLNQAQIKKIRHTLPACLIADLSGIIAAVVLGYFLFEGR